MYFGYRTDKYVLKYIANPLGKSDRLINHFGFSIGVFSGLGNTFMLMKLWCYFFGHSYQLSYKKYNSKSLWYVLVE